MRSSPTIIILVRQPLGLVRFRLDGCLTVAAGQMRLVFAPLRGLRNASSAFVLLACLLVSYGR